MEEFGFPPDFPKDSEEQSMEQNSEQEEPLIKDKAKGKKVRLQALLDIESSRLTKSGF